jgi:hypothetical protein
LDRTICAIHQWIATLNLYRANPVRSNRLTAVGFARLGFDFEIHRTFGACDWTHENSATKQRLFLVLSKIWQDLGCEHDVW